MRLDTHRVGYFYVRHAIVHKILFYNRAYDNGRKLEQAMPFNAVVLRLYECNEMPEMRLALKHIPSETLMKQPSGYSLAIDVDQGKDI